MSELKLTAQQKIAATASGNSLLVSAAAGSGKTMVLVQRLMGMICNDRQNADITDFLVITYTRAAAAELKNRVLKELNRRIEADPQNRHLRKQTMLCMKANISTIHSFCSELLKENAHLINLNPDFRVADEPESAMLKAEVLERVLDEKYDDIDNDPEFKALADLMMETKGDKKLSNAVLDAYEKLQSHPEPYKWMAFQEEKMLFSENCDISETIWGKEILDHAKTTVEYCLNRMSSAYDEMHDYPDMLKAYGASFETTIAGMEKFLNALKMGWDAARDSGEILFPTAKISGYEYFKNIRSECKKILEKELSVFDGSSAELIEDMRGTALEARGLYSTLRSFDKAYKAEKNKRGIIDFSDQEHLALKLLYDFENNCPSQIALEVSKRYREVLVDEYQDVNAVQEMIFSSVSRDGKNLFMVGDVKQSIYRFRMADPTIFLGKYLSFDDYSEELDSPQKIILPENFRSRAEILDAVNYVFKDLMSEAFGEMDYTENECLRAGAVYPENDESCVEYSVLEVPKEYDDLTCAEAEHIAGRIKELIDGKMQIPDGNEMRAAEYGDFAILLRSVKGRAWKYAVALDKLGIPVDIPTSDDFFESYEVSIVMSILAVIDNPHQDIPLITTLRSPIFRFSFDELAQLRSESRRGDIYSAVVKSSKENTKCKRFLEELAALREAAAEMSADKFIWMLYNRTGIIELICACDGGEGRRENLTILAELARRFEANGYKGLFGFLNQLSRMKEKGNQPVAQEGGSGKGVKIMSIHKSKGLEFPVVFLADTTHKFNMQDTTKPVLFHAELGIGLYRRNREKRYKYPTLARRAVSHRITLETLSEELRVLYVAMTRAKHKLIMVSTVRDADKEFAKYWPNGEYPAAPTRLESIRSFSGWLMTVMLSRTESIAAFEPTERVYAHPDGATWDIRKVKYIPVESEENLSEEPVTVNADTEILKSIEKNMTFEYGYKSSEALPSKITATEVKGHAADGEVHENAAVMYVKKSKLRKPDFCKKDKPLSGSDKGTALHYVMQYIDYSKCFDEKAVAEELKRLVEKRFVSQKQADAVKEGQIVSFFDSALGKRLLNSRKIEREFKFSVLVSAKELLQTECTEKLLLQGVIDCYFEEDDGIVVIDFKTDKVTPQNYDDKISTYTTQIKTYASAIGRVSGKKVKNAYLYFFDMNREIEII